MQEIFDMVDTHHVFDVQTDIDREYIASSDEIYSDGTVTKHPTDGGYIKIKGVKQGQYLLYVNSNNLIALEIYKYISDDKFAEIKSNIGMIRKATGITLKNKTKAISTTPTKQRVINKIAKAPNLIEKASEYVDVNTFKCPKCGGEINYILDMGYYITAECSACNIEYELRPSRYYLLASTKIKNKSVSKYAKNIKVKPKL